MAIGGLVGGSAGLVYDGRFSGRVTGKQAVGGLVGDMTGGVYHSSSDVEVDRVRGIGGLVGSEHLRQYPRQLAESQGYGRKRHRWSRRCKYGRQGQEQPYALATSSASSNNIGGLVGFNSQSSVRNSYARGDVSGADADRWARRPQQGRDRQQLRESAVR